jgi:hypothetical protein
MNSATPRKPVQPSGLAAFARLSWDHPGSILGIGLLPSILSICCLVGEIAASIGFLAAIALVPFAQSGVASGREGVHINVPRGAFEGCTFQFGDRSKQSGGFSIGPLRLLAEEESGHAAVQAVSIQDREGTVIIAQPASAAAALAYVRWSFILNLLCSGVTGVVILDLFRRMFGSVARREVFTAANVRNVYRLGILFIASSVAKMILAAWLVRRFIAFSALSLPQWSFSLNKSFEGDASGIGIGFMILVLAGVFYQGLALKEDNELTI